MQPALGIWWFTNPGQLGLHAHVEQQRNPAIIAQLRTDFVCCSTPDNERSGTTLRSPIATIPGLSTDRSDLIRQHDQSRDVPGEADEKTYSPRPFNNTEKVVGRSPHHLIELDSCDGEPTKFIESCSRRSCRRSDSSCPDAFSRTLFHLTKSLVQVHHLRPG